MKYLITLFIIINVSSCANRVNIVEVEETLEDQVIDDTVDIATDKTEEGEDVITDVVSVVEVEDREPMVVNINALISTYDVMVGDILTYSAVEHGSVGKQVKVNISNLRVLSKISNDFKYDKPLVKGMTGGDGGVRLYKYKVENAGEVTMTIQNIFRGDVEDEFEIKIRASN